MQRPPSYESTEFEPLNDLLNEWKDEEESEPSMPVQPASPLDSSPEPPLESSDLNQLKSKRGQKIFFI